jgi:hypothetical protein
MFVIALISPIFSLAQTLFEILTWSRYLMSFFRFLLQEKFGEIALWLRISRVSQPKKNAVPKIRRENWAILEKLQDSANFRETFYSTQKILQFRVWVLVRNNRFFGKIGFGFYRPKQETCGLWFLGGN